MGLSSSQPSPRDELLKSQIIGFMHRMPLGERQPWGMSIGAKDQPAISDVAAMTSEREVPPRSLQSALRPLQRMTAFTHAGRMGPGMLCPPSGSRPRYSCDRDGRKLAESGMAAYGR